MATGSAGTVARDYHTRQTAYEGVPITVTNLSPTLSVKIGTVPAGCRILRAGFVIDTVFNAGAANSISFGNAVAGAQIAAATAGANSLGVTWATLASSAALSPTVDTDIYAVGALSGTAATTGSGVAFIEFIPL